jgi:hypothetical protein
MIKNAFYCIVTSSLALLITSLASHAQQPDLSQKTLDDWTFGEVLVGDALDKDKLKGKVVVIEYWGVR